jgi:hypothetical protein
MSDPYRKQKMHSVTRQQTLSTLKLIIQIRLLDFRKVIFNNRKILLCRLLQDSWLYIIVLLLLHVYFSHFHLYISNIIIIINIIIDIITFYITLVPT